MKPIQESKAKRGKQSDSWRCCWKTWIKLYLKLSSSPEFFSYVKSELNLQFLNLVFVTHIWKGPNYYSDIRQSREFEAWRGNCCWVAQSSLTLCDLMDCSTPGFSVLHYLLEFAQTHIHWVSDIIQLSHPLLPPSPPALNLSQDQGLFQRVSSLHQVAKVLELQF